jgi:hypothetical protein
VAPVVPVSRAAGIPFLDDVLPMDRAGTGTANFLRRLVMQKTRLAIAT